MIRPELHRVSRTADALSHPPSRPRLDAIAWKAGKKQQETAAAEQVAVFLETLERTPRARRRDGAN